MPIPHHIDPPRAVRTLAATLTCAHLVLLFGCTDTKHTPKCNTETGIECDGDWTGRCAPDCTADECCSPLRGEFRCVARDDHGACPAPELSIDTSKLENSVTYQWSYFAADSCALEEHCVAAPGWRRLLRFNTTVANTGAADVYMGKPEDHSAYFEFSPCHGHFHFESFAEYALKDKRGNTIASGHKQAFCMFDTTALPDATGEPRYTCKNQGIQVGWEDEYGEALDCQWIDVTDTPIGTYTIDIALNTEQRILESDYTNNEAKLEVTILPDDSGGDPTQACLETTESLTRQCGWVAEGPLACTPGASVHASCSAACGAGSCAGDPVMRVCPGAGPCSFRGELGENDNSECTATLCGNGGDCCPSVPFVCPPEGKVTVLWAPRTSDATGVVCTPAVSP